MAWLACSSAWALTTPTEPGVRRETTAGPQIRCFARMMVSSQQVVAFDTPCPGASRAPAHTAAEFDGESKVRPGAYCAVAAARLTATERQPLRLGRLETKVRPDAT